MIFDSSKVARCPWVVETQDEAPPFSARSGIAFLGGFQHLPNEEGVRFFLDEIMPKLRLARPGLKLHIYGSQMSEAVLKLAADDVIVEGFVERVEDVYNRHRVFIAPLLSGAGLKGKVAGALAAGAPTVMTSLAAEGVGVSSGVEAIVVDPPSDWVEAIVSLDGDEARWTEMSARARRFARENFSFQRGVETMRAALAVAGVMWESRGWPEARPCYVRASEANPWGFNERKKEAYFFAYSQDSWAICAHLSDEIFLRR